MLANLNVYSGMTGIIVNYHRFLDRERVQFDYLYFDGGSETYEAEIHGLGGRVFRMPRPTNPVQFHRAMRAFFSDHAAEFAAVQCHPIWTTAAVAPYAAHYGVRHLIAHSHSTGFSEHRLASGRNYLLARLASRRATEWIACSEEAKRLFPGVQPEKIRVFTNGVDCERFHFDRAARDCVRDAIGASEQTLVLGNVGRLVPTKRQGFLLEVMAEVLKQQPDAHLLLVGSGPLEQTLREKCETLKIEDCVSFLGLRQDVERYCSAMDCFVFPSDFEGFGLVLAEAQASGLPCVAKEGLPKAVTDSPLVHLMSKDASPKKWADVVIRLGTEKRDRNVPIRPTMGERGLDIRVLAQQLSDFYEMLIS